MRWAKILAVGRIEGGAAVGPFDDVIGNQGTQRRAPGAARAVVEHSLAAVAGPLEDKLAPAYMRRSAEHAIASLGRRAYEPMIRSSHDWRQARQFAFHCDASGI